MTDTIDPAHLWLGAFVGALVLLVFSSVLKANAYRERAFLLHAAATLMALVAVQSLIGDQPLLPPAVLLLVPTVAGLQLIELVGHAGGLREARRWLLGVSVIGLPLFAIGALYTPWAMAAGMVLWLVAVVRTLVPSWRQSQPWIWWLPPALAALALAGLLVASQAGPTTVEDATLLAALLAAWAACTYLATGWRGRIVGETRARIQARNTVDPLTGLATPIVLMERVNASRHLTRRYAHPSVLMVVNVDNLAAIGQEFGLDAAEEAVLAAASRIRDALMRDGDVAARLAHGRFGVLAEGVAPGQAASTVAGRILVAGLKDPLPSVRAEFLRFRIVMAAVPASDVSPKVLMQRLNARLDQEVQGAAERRIVTLTQEELLA
jgi:GGDEF domain-containing protein